MAATAAASARGPSWAVSSCVAADGSGCAAGVVAVDVGAPRHRRLREVSAETSRSDRGAAGPAPATTAPRARRPTRPRTGRGGAAQRRRCAAVAAVGVPATTGVASSTRPGALAAVGVVRLVVVVGVAVHRSAPACAERRATSASDAAGPARRPSSTSHRRHPRRLRTGDRRWVRCGRRRLGRRRGEAEVTGARQRGVAPAATAACWRQPGRRPVAVAVTRPPRHRRVGVTAAALTR